MEEWLDLDGLWGFLWRYECCRRAIGLVWWFSTVSKWRCGDRHFHRGKMSRIKHFVLDLQLENAFLRRNRFNIEIRIIYLVGWGNFFYAIRFCEVYDTLIQAGMYKGLFHRWNLKPFHARHQTSLESDERTLLHSWCWQFKHPGVFFDGRNQLLPKWTF